jgi:hypothetical protein
MAVTVSADNTVSISITDANAIAVNVGQVQQSGVTAYGGIGPTIVVSGTHTAYIGTIGINPFVAGPNITITQSAGNITFSGRDPQTPTTMVSVSGGDGDNVTLADDLNSLGDGISALANRTLDVNTPSGRLVVSGPSGRLGTATSYVSSVFGRTGTVTISTLDITKANGARCAYDFQGSSWASGPFFTPDSATSVNDLGGSIVLSSSSLWDGPSARAWLSANDNAVAVDPNYADSFRAEINAAPVSHSHGNITPSGSVGTAAGKILVTLVGGVVTAVASISTTQITGISDKFPPSAVPENLGLVSSNNGPGGTFQIKTSSGFVHTLNGCTGTVSILAAGGNISISNNTTLNRITISSSGGGGGGGGVTAIWPALIFGG